MIVLMHSGMEPISSNQDMTSGSTQKQIQKKKLMFTTSVLGAGKLLNVPRNSTSVFQNK